MTDEEYNKKLKQDAIDIMSEIMELDNGGTLDREHVLEVLRANLPFVYEKGAAENGIIWHKDKPKEDGYYLVYCRVPLIDNYRYEISEYSGFCWRVEIPKGDGCPALDVIAWAEIPQCEEKDETVNTQQDELEKLNNYLQRVKNAIAFSGSYWSIKLTLSKELVKRIKNSNILFCDNTVCQNTYMGIPFEIGDKTEVKLYRDIEVFNE